MSKNVIFQLFNISIFVFIKKIIFSITNVLFTANVKPFSVFPCYLFRNQLNIIKYYILVNVFYSRCLLYCTLERGIWDLLSRLTFWKLERLEKEKSRLSEDFLEAALSEDTADTPNQHTSSSVMLLFHLLLLCNKYIKGNYINLLLKITYLCMTVILVFNKGYNFTKFSPFGDCN
jgi:hypothetical protein